LGLFTQHFKNPKTGYFLVIENLHFLRGNSAIFYRFKALRGSEFGGELRNISKGWGAGAPIGAGL